MYWEEKIDLIKKQFPGDFKDPFRTGREIIQKITERLFNSRVSDFMQSDDKAALLKDRSLTKQCSVKQFYHEELPRLDNGSSIGYSSLKCQRQEIFAYMIVSTLH